MIDLIGCAAFYIMFALFIIMCIWLVNKAYKLQAETREIKSEIIEVTNEEFTFESIWKHINAIIAVCIMCVVYLIEKVKRK